LFAIALLPSLFSIEKACPFRKDNYFLFLQNALFTAVLEMLILARAEMSKKFLSIIVFLLLTGSVIATQGCVILVPETSAPSETTTPSQSTNNAAEFANPGWSFPSSNIPTSSLPDFRAVFNEIMPSVVVITTKTIAYGEEIPLGAGSGVIIDAREGYSLPTIM